MNTQTLSIYTDNIQELQDIIGEIEGLEQLISLSDIENIEDKEERTVVVKSNFIHLGLDWSNASPPLIFQPIPFTSSHFLNVIYVLLSGKGFDEGFLKEEALSELAIYGALIGREPIQKTNIEQQNPHNKAIIHTFGNVESPINFETLCQYYKTAIETETEAEKQLYTVLHYAFFLTDNALFEEAEELLWKNVAKAPNTKVEMALKKVLAETMVAQISPQNPQNASTQSVKELLNEIVEFYEKTGSAYTLLDTYLYAAELSLRERSYSEALGYISKALTYAMDLGIEDMTAKCNKQKGDIFFIWSLNGNPQFFQSAIDAYQKALKVFKEDIYPSEFAEIQKSLGIIYAEMPAEEDKKAIWSAFSASSFKNALKFYTEEDFPYENASIKHNFALAIMKFPPSKRSDNLQKASELLDEILIFRTADLYPTERVYTLLNKIELYWLLHNEDESIEKKRKDEMLSILNEIQQLSQEPSVLQHVNQHLELLSKIEI